MPNQYRTKKGKSLGIYANYFHQVITGNIFSILKNRLKAKNNSYFALVAPYEIKLEKNHSQNVLQPDVMIFCDKKTVEKEINNIPSIVFEVTSPSTSKNDYGTKKELYEIFGIKEYYIISPEYKTVEKFALQNEKLTQVDIFVEDQKFFIDLLEEEIEIKELFGE